jgi:hypothetical protein
MQILAPQVLHLNCHSRVHTFAARVVDLNRHHLAPERFHLNYHPFELVLASERVFGQLKSDWHSLRLKKCSIVNT